MGIVIAHKCSDAYVSIIPGTRIRGCGSFDKQVALYCTGCDKNICLGGGKRWFDLLYVCRMLL